jgi:hypothetical protein
VFKLGSLRSKASASMKKKPMQSLSESARLSLNYVYSTNQFSADLMHGHIEYINKFGVKTLNIICAYFTALLHEQSLSLPSGM